MKKAVLMEQNSPIFEEDIYFKISNFISFETICMAETIMNIIWADEEVHYKIKNVIFDRSNY